MTTTWPAACTFSPIGVAGSVHSSKDRSPRTPAASAGPFEPPRPDGSPTGPRRPRPGADGEHSLAPVASANCAASPPCRGAAFQGRAAAGEDAARLVGGRHGAAAEQVGHEGGGSLVWPVLGELGPRGQGRPRGGPTGVPARPTAGGRETGVGHYTSRRPGVGPGSVAVAVLGGGLVGYAPFANDAAAQLNEQPDRLLTHRQGACHRIWRSTAPHQQNTMSPSSGWRGGLDRKPTLPWAISCATSGISLTRGRRQARGVHVCAGWNGSHGC